jgi:dihydrofolate reductase
VTHSARTEPPIDSQLDKASDPSPESGLPVDDTPARRVPSCSVFIATSLDGYIARSDGAIDWLPADGGEPHGYNEFFASIDGLVIGRKTYELVLSFDTWPYGTKPVVVLSSTLTSLSVPAGAVCDLLSGLPRDVVATLAARGMRHLYIDGGVTVQRFIAAGLIQRVIITRIPILLGSGIPLFGAVPHDIRLEHVATRSYKSGLVQSEYVVEG